jgi:hypothetical protein
MIRLLIIATGVPLAVEGGHPRCMGSTDGGVPLELKRASKLERHSTPQHGDVCRRSDRGGFFCPSTCEHLQSSPWCAETVCGHYLSCTVRREEVQPVHDLDGSNCTLSRRQREYLKYQRVQERQGERLQRVSYPQLAMPTAATTASTDRDEGRSHHPSDGGGALIQDGAAKVMARRKERTAQRRSSART